MAKPIDILVPELGDFSDVEVIEVLVAAGDTVAAEDGLITLETDKAAMDVPAPKSGVIEKLSVSVGAIVNSGDVIGTLMPEDGVSRDAVEPDPEPAAPAREPAAPAAVSETETATETETVPRSDRPAAAPPSMPPSINEAGFARAHASPSVRKLARELGVDLVRVAGRGAKGRILHDDVKAFVKSLLSGAAPGGLPPLPLVDFAQFGDIERAPLTRIQKISGPRLQASWVNLPHVTQHDLADITALEARRKALKESALERGIRLTPLAFVIKACVAALKALPTVNASLAEDGDQLILKRYVHIGFAADTDQGLVVPVIRDADQKDVYELAAELGELSGLAREGRLKAPQLQGATFTVSSLGGIGGTAFTPIVNAPEAAILGVSRSSVQPVWDGEAFQPRLLLPLSLSYDHRVIDGAMAVRFTTYLGKALADVDTLLEAIP